MRIKKLAPWEIYYRELDAFFNADPKVDVLYDSEKQEIKVYVEGEEKADALETILRSRKVFGNVELNINVIPSNDGFEGKPIPDILRSALGSHEDVHNICHIKGPYEAVYVSFNPRVLQYYSDDLGSLYGLSSALYEDVARRIFNDSIGIFYCTEEVDK